VRIRDIIRNKLAHKIYGETNWRTNGAYKDPTFVAIAHSGFAAMGIFDGLTSLRTTMISIMANLLSAVLALAAGLAWVLSARASVGAPAEYGIGATIGGRIYDTDGTGGKINVLATMRKQSRWNRRAAWLAAAAALAQSAGIGLSIGSL
jgi:hypothetical protein